MADPRVVVVGAGPAGVRAAEALVAGGLRPVVVDEGSRDGGQIYRRQPEGFSRGYAALYGTEARRARALHLAFDGIRGRVEYRPGVLVWGLWDGVLKCERAGRAVDLRYDALVLATGATDRLLPVTGWQRAGCYSLGAAQIALKAQAVSVGRQVAFLGTGPLLYLVAAQYLKAGAEVAAVLDTSPLAGRLTALPRMAARPRVLLNGLRLVAALRRGGVRVETGVVPVEVTGTDAGVTGLRYRDARGAEREVAADAVAMGWHLRPETQLADLARCAFRFDAATRLWLPEADAEGRSSVKGVYLAGDGARVLGADAAEAAGELAALALLSDLGRPADAGRKAELGRKLRRMERFRDGLLRAFPWPAELAASVGDGAVLCRCEGVTAGEVREAAREKGASEINRTKALSRVGMGRCQGRYCGAAAAEVIAAALGAGVAEVGRIRGQAPVKPLCMAVERDDD